MIVAALKNEIFFKYLVNGTNSEVKSHTMFGYKLTIVVHYLLSKAITLT